MRGLLDNKGNLSGGNCKMCLASCLKSYHDIVCEIDKLRDRLEEIRRSPPHCYCSAVLYWSKVKAVEKEMREWQDLAREEEVEISRLEEIVKSKREIVK